MFCGSANIYTADSIFRVVSLRLQTCTARLLPLSALKPGSGSYTIFLRPIQIDITARGRETILARWILRRVKVERVRVVEASLPGDGGGGKDGASTAAQRAPKTIASWKTVSGSIPLRELQQARNSI